MNKESKLNLNAGDYTISHCDSDKTYNGLEVHKMLCDAYIAGSNETFDDEAYRKAYYDGYNKCNRDWIHSQEDERIRHYLMNFVKINDGVNLPPDYAKKALAWLENQNDCIKLSDSAYTSNRDVIEFADKYSHTVWENLMDKFKKNENYSIGCNDVSDIVLNAIINTYNWLEKQGQVKESTISQHEIETCEENGNSLTYEDERIRKAIKVCLIYCNSINQIENDVFNDCIAWLENIPYTIDHEKREGFHLGYRACLEKRGEQKPADSYCQENCKGFQETGKCFADGDCKAKREAERR